MTGTAHFPVIWALLLVLNWPVYAFVWRQMFVDSSDVKRSILAALKPALFWNWQTEEPWSAAKVFGFIIVCGLIVSFEYALLIALITMAVA
jgi:hypothetical protein